MLFCFLTQNFAEIGQSISYFQKRFSNWRSPPSWIIKEIQFLVTWLQSGWTFAVAYRISLKSDNFSLRYGDSTIFQIRGRPLSWILKNAFFVQQPLSTCRFASSYKISLKSDNRLMSKGQKSDFQDGGHSHLEFKKFQFLVTWLPSGSISDVVY